MGANAATARRLGRPLALLTAALTAASFGIAVMTPPRSGPSCTGDACVGYPYTAIADFFPRDYLWMFPATLLVFVVVALAVAVHYAAPEGRKPFTLLAIVLASIAAALLSVDYFIQLTVIQPSVLRGETDGLSLFSQYNPHGVFIALEALGYLLMSAALACLAPAITGRDRVARACRWVFVGALVLSVACLGAFAAIYGHDVEYRYEIAVISVTWTALFIGSLLLAAWFHRLDRTERS